MSDTGNEKNYKADLFMFIPFAIDEPQGFYKGIEAEISGNEQNQLGKEYLETMDTVFRYECVKVLASDIQRVYLGDYRLSCRSDSTMHTVEEFEGEVMLFLSYSKLTNLAVLMMMSPVTSFPLSFMLEELNRNNGMLNTDRGVMQIDEYMKERFCAHRCGAMKHVVGLSCYPADPAELMYITMSEEYGLDEKESALKDADRHKFEEIGQYEILDAYASYAGVTLVFNEYEEDSIERLYHESIFLFTCELLQFKLLAITRTNRVVVDMLEKSTKPTIKEIEKSSEQFAKTIRFWDTDNFRYLSTRKMAQAMSRAFETDELMEIYGRNQTFLEHLINIRTAQESEKENRVLSTLAVVLTLIQLIPIFYNIVVGAIGHTISMHNVISAVSACGITAAFTLVAILIIKNSGNRKL